MKIFGKKSNVFVVVVVMAAFLAGCSNLWDYQPKSSNNKKPGNPTDQTPPPSLNQKTLTFRVIDGTGVEKSVTVQVPGTSNSVPIGQIKAAFKTQYPNSTIPEGWEEDGEWYESDLTQKATGNYSDGALLAIGLKPKQVGYTSSITTAGGGKREFLTDVTWGEETQTLSTILTKAGIAAGGDDKYKPDDVPDDWEFQGWATADAPTNILTPTDDTKYASGTNFVAVYNVPYKINIRGTDYEVTVPVTAPNTGATWEQILAAAKTDDNIVNNALGGDASKLDTMLWTNEDGDDPAQLRGKQYPAGETFVQQDEINYNIKDLNGVTQIVSVKVPAGGTTATWEQIKTAATAQGISLDAPSGYTGGGWTAASTLLANDTSVDPGNLITPDFTKDVSYTVDGQNVTVKLTYPESEATWVQIKAAATNPIDESKIWKDGNGKIVSDVKAYPEGTSFTSSNSTNAATGGSAERVVTVAEPDRTPQIGDKLYKDPNGKGWIIAKDDGSKDDQADWDLLGYVYEVGDDVVKVVSKEIGDAKWARQGGAVYTGKSPEPSETQSLSQKLSSVTDGYTAWITVGGNFEIKDGSVVNKGETSPINSKTDVKNAWNPDALFRNYDAISWALCYPASNKTRGQLDTNHPLYKQNDSTKILEYLQNNPPPGLNAKSWTKEVVQIVTGNTVESRWYLPSVDELKKVYAAGPQLLNWSELSDKKFWSVEVKQYTGSYSEANEKFAQYVDFNNNGTENTIDKQSTGYKVLAIAQFNYTTM